jgi:hypothetical protein
VELKLTKFDLGFCHGTANSLLTVHALSVDGRSRISTVNGVSHLHEPLQLRQSDFPPGHSLA